MLLAGKLIVDVGSQTAGRLSVAPFYSTIIQRSGIIHSSADQTGSIGGYKSPGKG